MPIVGTQVKLAGTLTALESGRGSLQVDHQAVTDAQVQVHVPVYKEADAFNLVHEHAFPVIVVAGRYDALALLFLVVRRWFYDDRDTQNWIVKPSRFDRHQVQLADETFHARALIRYDLKVGAERVNFEDAKLALEVGCVVPLYDRVLHHANATQVAMDLHDAVRMLMMPVFIVVEHGLSCRLTDLWYEPLQALNIYQSLHAEEIDRDFNYVTLTHLHYRLNQRSLLNALELVCAAHVVEIALV